MISDGSASTGVPKVAVLWRSGVTTIAMIAAVP
jgi:hypothetical protein